MEEEWTRLGSELVMERGKSLLFSICFEQRLVDCAIYGEEWKSEELQGGKNHEFCFGCIKFETHISYEVVTLTEQLDVLQIWNSQKRAQSWR